MVVNGLISIRAYNKLAFFRAQFMNESELSANVTFTYVITNRWMGFRLDLGILVLSLVASGFCVGLKNVVDNQLLAFSLQLITDFTVYFSISIRVLTELQNYMTSAQSIHAYTQVEIEDELQKPLDSIL